MALYKNPKKDLKNHYKRIFEISIIVSLIFVIAAFSLSPEKINTKKLEKEVQDVINIVNVDRTIHERIQLPPKPPMPIDIIPSEDFIDPELPDTELNPEAEVKTQPIQPPGPKHVVEEEQDFFVVVEEKPEPIGGMRALYQNLVYPELAVRAGVQGTVKMIAYVDKLGDVVRVEVQKGIGAGCDEAAMKAVQVVKFKPGKQRGKPVNVALGLSIRFVLQN